MNISIELDRDSGIYSIKVIISSERFEELLRLADINSVPGFGVYNTEEGLYFSEGDFSYVELHSTDIRASVYLDIESGGYILIQGSPTPEGDERLDGNWWPEELPLADRLEAAEAIRRLI